MSSAPAVAWLSHRKPGTPEPSARVTVPRPSGAGILRRKPPTSAAGRLQTSSSMAPPPSADAHHAGPLRRAAGQGVEAIDRRGLARALQPAAQLGELAVERQAAHVRADDGDGDAILGDHGIVRRRPAAGSWSCRAAAAPRAASARRRPAGRARRCAAPIRVMPNGMPSGRKPAGSASARRARRSSRSWCSGRDASCRAPARARDRRRGRSCGAVGRARKSSPAICGQRARLELGQLILAFEGVDGAVLAAGHARSRASPARCRPVSSAASMKAPTAAVRSATHGPP